MDSNHGDIVGEVGMWGVQRLMVAGLAILVLVAILEVVEVVVVAI